MAASALIATGRRPQHVRSLTLVEPPAFGLVLVDPAVRSAVAAFDDLRRIASPDEFLPAFLEVFLGHAEPPRPLGPDMRRLVELTMHERAPWTAELPLAALREAGTPVLVVTGGHSRLFDIAADALQAELGLTAGRVVLPGARHAIPRLGDPFNAELEHFWLRAELPR